MGVVKLTVRNTGWWVFRDVLRDRRSFSTGGSLRGVNGRSSGGLGKLPAEYHRSVDDATYVVFSYRTPIAWRNGDGSWSVPEVKYSATTSQQQSKIGVACAELNREREAVSNV
jgi:hypothetical protein